MSKSFSSRTLNTSRGINQSINPERQKRNDKSYEERRERGQKQTGNKESGQRGSLKRHHIRIKMTNERELYETILVRRTKYAKVMQSLVCLRKEEHKTDVTGEKYRE